jgi:hypothetical protein
MKLYFTQGGKKVKKGKAIPLQTGQALGVPGG